MEAPIIGGVDVFERGWGLLHGEREFVNGGLAFTGALQLPQAKADKQAGERKTKEGEFGAMNDGCHERCNPFVK